MTLIVILILVILYFCHSYVGKAWESMKMYRIEENVLLHFENDPNPLKYKAAHFILENMSYQHSYSDEDLRVYRFFFEKSKISFFTQGLYP